MLTFIEKPHSNEIMILFQCQNKTKFYH